MKKSFLLLLSFIVLAGSSTFAQNTCEGFGQFRKGLKTQMTNYDKNDKITSVVDQEVTDLTTIKGELEATSKVSMTDNKGEKKFESFSTKIRCANGSIRMNFQDFIGRNPAMQKMEGAEMKITGDELVFPTSLSIGQTLPENAMTMEMILNGTPLMKMTFTMKDRKVVAKETITSPAGTWECYKITYTMTNSTGFGGDTTGALWLSNGMTIKTESYDKKGKKMGSGLMTKFQKP